MGSLIKLALGCACVLASSIVSAQFTNPFGQEPTVSYSGVREMVTSEGTIKMKEYTKPKMQRMEMEGPSGPMVMINRLDKGVAWMLMPSMNMYMEIPVDQFEAQSGGMVKVIEHEKVGTETLDGIKVDKYKSVFEDDKGNRGGGFYWITEDGIPIQMDMVLKEGDKKQRVKMKLTELEVGEQPMSLFEIPEGFSGMPTMGGIKSATGMGTTNPSQGTANKQPRTPGLKDLLDMY